MKVVYIQPDGERNAFDVPEGTSVMQAAVSNSVEGIIAECGGSVMCATCHVFVDEESTVSLPPASADEHEMLNVTATPRRPTSRLSCQLIVRSGAGELVVQIPETQI